VHERPVVVFSGGGTGGHLYPALAIADALRARRPDVRAIFIGAERGLEARILPSRGEEHVLLPVHGIDRSRIFGNWRALTGLAVALWRVARLFARTLPDVVVVTGGYAGAAAGIGAGLMGIPLVLQEQNSLPGAVTKLLTRWAVRIHVAFPEAIDRLPAAREQVRVTGNPVRGGSAADRSVARAAFGIPENVTLVLVVGGSQGSVPLNRVMVELLLRVAAGELSLPGAVHFLWATGPKHFDGVCATLERLGRPAYLHVVHYFDDMPSALAAADLAISRAGAMSTAEFLNEGLPAVLVPLPTSAEGHQMYNALALQEAGAAVVVPQDELDSATLVAALADLVSDPVELEEMGRRALKRGRPHARAEIAADLDSLLSSQEALA
jgi:UDP-N-acetylglucosamine--N-acetylmuramyl-(pentapeptide) pyrophosphoryl-undecaprenol N-acetylglucosamine transferase